MGGKIVSGVTEINRRWRLQKLQSMFKIDELMKTANEAVAETLEDKDLNLTKVDHLIYATQTIVT